jgi:hypothetical protein
MRIERFFFGLGRNRAVSHVKARQHELRKGTEVHTPRTGLRSIKRSVLTTMAAMAAIMGNRGCWLFHP